MEKKITHKESGKTVFKFVLIMIVAMVIGGIAGAGSVMLGKAGAEEAGKAVSSFLYMISPYATIVVVAVAIVISSVLYGQSVKIYKSIQGDSDESDEAVDRIEYKLSIAMMVVSGEMIISYLFFAIGFCAMEAGYPSFDHQGMTVLLLGGLFLSIFYTIFMQKKIVDFEKTLNPEKNGSVFDTQFASKWIESCDEAERLMIYKASYSAYKSVNLTCTILWLVSLVGMVLWNFGMVPVFMVAIIWLVSLITYCMKSMQMYKK